MTMRRQWLTARVTRRAAHCAETPPLRSDGICVRPYSAFAAAMQRRQRHACPSAWSGTAAIATALTVTSVHQQGVAKSPVRAGAQSFGPPQTGHTTLGFGNMSQRRA